MQDHGVSDFDVGYTRSYLLDPAGILVAEYVGQQRAVRILDRGPLAFDDVDIGAAEPGGTDPDDDVQRLFYLRLFYLRLFNLLDLETVRWDALVVPVQSRRFHSVASFIWMPCGVIGGVAVESAAPPARKFKLRDGSGRSLREGARRG